MEGHGRRLISIPPCHPCSFLLIICATLIFERRNLTSVLEKCKMNLDELLSSSLRVPDYTINLALCQIITYRSAALRGVWGAPGAFEECPMGSQPKCEGVSFSAIKLTPNPKQLQNAWEQPRFSDGVLSPKSSIKQHKGGESEYTCNQMHPGNAERFIL